LILEPLAFSNHPYTGFNYCGLRRRTKQRGRGQCAISTGTCRYWALADIEVCTANLRFQGKADMGAIGINLFCTH
jgi:hypothetical protein